MATEASILAMTNIARQTPTKLLNTLRGKMTRIGAAQDMMVAGFDILAIMQAGGWTTPHVAARYVERASTRQLHERRWAALGLEADNEAFKTSPPTIL